MRVPLGDLPSALVEYDPIFAGEPGKLLFPEYNRWIDGIYAASKLLELISSKEKPLSEIVSEIPSYPIHRENFSCPDEKKEEFMEDIKSYLLENVKGIRNKIEADGLRVNRTDGSWILIRTSGTEPKARMVVEGKSKEDSEELLKIGRKGIKKILE